MNDSANTHDDVATDSQEPQVQLKIILNEKPVELYDDTKIEFVSENPKREGTKIHALWDTYSKATTIAELKEKFGKGWKAAVKFDAPRGHLKILDQ